MAYKGVLQFQNPVFNKGVNTTVRNGLKWSGLRPGDTVEVRRPPTPVDDAWFTGTISKVTILKFKDIDNSLLKKEHDPACRNTKGLLKVMKQVYAGFTKDNVVVVIDFTV